MSVAVVSVHCVDGAGATLCVLPGLPAVFAAGLPDTCPGPTPLTVGRLATVVVVLEVSLASLPPSTSVMPGVDCSETTSGSAFLKKKKEISVALIMWLRKVI